jgi:peptidoglycan/xylan/chitin deacetylase (PgdA/CDA1 family)
MLDKKLVKLAALFMEFPRLKLKQGVILNYHSICDDLDMEINIDISTFEWQMQFLKSHFDIVPLGEECMSKGKISITFDDAYMNFKTNALPILTRLDLPVTLFVPTNFILNGLLPLSKSPVHAAKFLKPLEWADLVQMSKLKNVRLGLHSHYHKRYDEMNVVEISEDIKISKQLFEKQLGLIPEIFAFPQGMLNKISLNVVLKEFKSVYGLNFNSKLLTTSHPQTMIRQSILKSDGRFFFKRKINGYLRDEDKIKSLIKSLKQH